MAASPLRGFDPDAGLPQDDDRDEGSRADGSDDDGSDASCDEAPEVGEQSEQEWAEFMFREKRLAKFLSNRSADNYAPTLWITPKIPKNLLRFMVQRRVFPRYQAAIKALLPVCDIAQMQNELHGLSRPLRILRQISGALSLLLAVQTLFPDTASTLDSPIVVKPDPKSEEPVDLPDMFGNVSLAGGPESDDEENADRLAPISEVFTWASGSKPGRGGDAEPKDPEEAMRAHAERIKKQSEEDAQRIDAWTKPLADREPATSALKMVLSLTCLGTYEPEGVWRIGVRERTARPIVSWRSLGLAPFRSTSRRFVELSLESRELDFPLTSLHLPSQLRRSKPSRTLRSTRLRLRTGSLLRSPCSWTWPSLTRFRMICTPPRTGVLDADLVQLVFVPSSEPEDAHAARVWSLWCLERLYRVVPAYWRHAGELLRLEPGQQLSLPGPYAPIRPEVLARIMELPESESESESASESEEVREGTESAS